MTVDYNFNKLGAVSANQDSLYRNFVVGNYSGTCNFRSDDKILKNQPVILIITNVRR